MLARGLGGEVVEEGFLWDCSGEELQEIPELGQWTKPKAEWESKVQGKERSLTIVKSMVPRAGDACQSEVGTHGPADRPGAHWV